MGNKKLLIVLLLALTISCQKEDGISCTTCSSSQTSDFELCRQSNGNASVNGKDTGTDYDVYLANLKEEGAECGG